MLYAVIVAMEIAFWALLVGGLYVRYALDRGTMSTAMLFAAASTDLVVLAVAALDLAGGATAQTSHVFVAAAGIWTAILLIDFVVSLPFAPQPQ
jgi:hypothetical protein